MTRSRRSSAAATCRPEAERAYLAGLLELFTDDLARCREASQLATAEAFTIEAGPELFTAIVTAAALEAPVIPDVARIARELSPEPAPIDGHDPAVTLMAALMDASAAFGRACGGGVDRHAREIVQAAARRRTIEAAAVAEAVAADPRATAEELQAAARDVADAPAGLSSDQAEWVPFPVDLLPEPVASFVAETAAAMSTDPALVALPMLAAIAASIGNRRSIRLRPDWEEPSLLWTATVAGSGSMKTPAADKALAFIRQRQREAFDTYRAAVADWEQEKAAHDAARRGRKVEAEPLPERPVAERFVVDDCTIESLAPLLEQNPAGLLLARDELAGWFDFDRYSGGRGGAEVARWLTIYSAGPLCVDRKLSGTTYIPSANVSITGSIQPATLARVVGSRHVENGLLQRFILASPPRRMKMLSDGGIGFATLEAMRAMFATLADVRPEADGTPKILDLGPDAIEAWEQFFKEHAAEVFHTPDGPVKEMLSKAEAWAGRLALVCHVAAQAGGDPTRGDRVTLDSMLAGIGLARWAAREWERVFLAMQGGSLEQSDAALVRWLAARGGVATPRDVQRGLRQYRAPGAAEAALARLSRAGRAEWEARPTGGRPADTARLR